MSPDNLSESDVIVAGAGPAGLSAALAAVTLGAKTLLLDKMDRPGVKLLASGGGKCNFSNVLDSVPFMNAFGRNGRFMTEALRVGGRDWLCDFLRGENVIPEAADGRHYFPAGGKSLDVLNAFLFAAKRQGLQFRSSARIAALQIEDNVLRGVRLADGSEHACRKLVLACGGSAMSALGGSSDGLKLAEGSGHRIVPTGPAMAPLYLAESWVKKLAGVSLPACTLSFQRKRETIRAKGELVFTHDGLSGPAALDLSGPAYRAYAADGALTIRLNACPGTFSDAPTCAHWIDEQRRNAPKKKFRSSLGEILPRSLAGALCEEAQCAETLNASLKNTDRERLAQFLTETELHISRACPMDRAMAMTGGVDLRDTDPKTMGSRIVNGLYFAGELLDLTGPCGGFNIQFAVASGRLAGTAAAESLT